MNATLGNLGKLLLLPPPGRRLSDRLWDFKETVKKTDDDILLMYWIPAELGL